MRIGRQRLDEHLDRSAAGETDVPGHFVGDSVTQQFRLAGFQDFLRFLEHCRFNATTTYRAGKITAARDDHRRSDRTWSGSFDLDDRSDGDLITGRGPGINFRE